VQCIVPFSYGATFLCAFSILLFFPAASLPQTFVAGWLMWNFPLQESHSRAERQIRHLTITNCFTGASCNQSEMSFLRDLCVLVAKKTSGLVFFARQI
jgi:hypothetical protein